MYSIGKFSELCDVPVKTLRYYSEIGLLKPSYIDPITNYRYYDYDKLQAMKKIMLFRNCQLSLAEIHQMIEHADQDQWMSILNQQIGKLEEQKIQISQQIEEIHHLKNQIEQERTIVPGPLLSNCYLESREATTVYTIRRQLNIALIDHFVKQLFERIYAYGLEVNGKLMAVFHARDINKKDADVELLLPIVPMKNSNKLENCKIVAGGLFACITVKGLYSELEAGYRTVIDYIKEQNYNQIGPAMEIYEQGLLPPSINVHLAKDIKPDLSRHPSEFLTTIIVPVANADR